jgi:hypothetical protein
MSIGGPPGDLAPVTEEMIRTVDGLSSTHVSFQAVFHAHLWLDKMYAKSTKANNLILQQVRCLITSSALYHSHSGVNCSRSIRAGIDLLAGRSGSRGRNEISRVC